MIPCRSINPEENLNNKINEFFILNIASEDISRHIESKEVFDKVSSDLKNSRAEKKVQKA